VRETACAIPTAICRRKSKPLDKDISVGAPMATVDILWPAEMAPTSICAMANAIPLAPCLTDIRTGPTIDTDDGRSPERAK
jgi:hypothetical protein